jgi:hypothetical protein
MGWRQWIVRILYCPVCNRLRTCDTYSIETGIGEAWCRTCHKKFTFNESNAAKFQSDDTYYSDNKSMDR